MLDLVSGAAAGSRLWSCCWISLLELVTVWSRGGRSLEVPGAGPLIKQEKMLLSLFTKNFLYSQKVCFFYTKNVTLKQRPNIISKIMTELFLTRFHNNKIHHTYEMSTYIIVMCNTILFWDLMVFPSITWHPIWVFHLFHDLDYKWFHKNVTNHTYTVST